MDSSAIDHAFQRFRTHADPEALAAVFDATAPELLRIANHLCSDLDAAEDLVQTTFLTAIEHRDRFTPNPGVLPWLIGILTHRSRRLHRDQQRRVNPDRIERPTERDPSATAEGHELSEALSDAIAALPESYRPVLILHLRNGLSAREIALALERPPGTVRTQIVRGLEQVRRALPVGFAIGIAGIAMPGTGLAAIRQVVLDAGMASSAVTLTVPLAAATLITMKKLITLCAVLLVGVTVWLADPFGSTDPTSAGPSTTPNGRTAESSAREATVPVHAEPTPAAANSRTKVEGQADWMVRGTVKRGYKGPFPGAAVTVEIYSGYAVEGSPLRTQQVRADAEGKFECGLVRPDETVTVLARTTVDNAGQDRTTELVVAGNPAPTELELNCFPLDVNVVGTVTDDQGHAVPGSMIKSGYRGKYVDTDENGHFDIAGSSVSSRIQIYAFSPGFACERASVPPPEPGGTAELNFTLSSALIVRGSVVDEAGAPVADATVATFFTGYARKIKTDASGQFTLDYLEKGRKQHSLYARKQGFIEAHIDIDANKVDSSYKLVLKRGARVEGRLFGPDGDPVRGAPIYIGFSPSAYNRLDAVSRDDGGYVFPNVTPGVQDIVVEAKGYAPDLAKITIPDDGPVFHHDIHLGAAHWIEGTIRNEAGEPLAEIGVSARESSESKGNGRYIGRRTSSDANGHFRLEDLPSPTVDIEFYGKKILRHVAKNLRVDEGDHEISVQRAGGLAGRVVDAVTGEPIDTFRIRFTTSASGMSATWVREGTMFQGTDGVWSMRPTLKAGIDITVEAYAKGYGPHRMTMKTSVDSDPMQHTHALTKGQTVSGTVISAAGAPIVGARVVMFQTDDPRTQHEGFHGRIIATTDGRGQFVMHDMPTGQISLAIDHDDWPSFTDGPFEVSGVAPVERFVTLSGYSHLRGTVVGVTGQPIANATVRIEGPRQANSSLQGKLKTDALGRFEYPGGLSAGTYNLWIDPGDTPPNLVLSATVKIEQAQTYDVKLAPLGVCELRGTVVTEDAKLVGAGLILFRLGGKEFAPGINRLRSLSRDGSFHLTGLPAGDYHIMLTGTYGYGTAKTTLTEDQVTDLKVVIKKHNFGR